MYQPSVIPTTYSSVAGTRSRVVTGPAPRLTAPLMRSSIVNPGSPQIAAASARTKGTTTGELAVADADARPGGAPFPAIHPLIVGFDPLKEEEKDQHTTKVLKKGQLIAIWAIASRIKKGQALPKHARGFLACPGDQVNTKTIQYIATINGNRPHTFPDYIGIVAEQTTYNCHELVPLAIVVEHTITLAKSDFHSTTVDRQNTFIAGRALTIAFCIAPDTTADNAHIKIIDAANTTLPHIPYKSAIITVNDHHDRIQACITADHLPCLDGGNAALATKDLTAAPTYKEHAEEEVEHLTDATLKVQTRLAAVDLATSSTENEIESLQRKRTSAERELKALREKKVTGQKITNATTKIERLLQDIDTRAEEVKDLLAERNSLKTELDRLTQEMVLKKQALELSKYPRRGI